MRGYVYSAIPNWKHLRARYSGFWDGKVLDGSIIAHIQNPNPNPPAPETWRLESQESKYLDPAKLYRLMSRRRTSWNWHADLFEYKVPSYGPNFFAGFCQRLH